jgi:hypothetical protein
MKKLCLFAAAAAAAGLTLVSASPPGTDGGAGAKSAASGYPPCSRTVTDKCIQRYERGVGTSARGALDDSLGEGRPGAAAQGGPYEAAPPAATGGKVYPPCSATLRDNCTQRHARRHHRERRVRRAGERG